jgi:hypothetical protein
MLAKSRKRSTMLSAMHILSVKHTVFREVRLNHQFDAVQAELKLAKQRWSKAAELVKVARKDGDSFDCATWLHAAKELSKEGFKTEVERYLTGKETEPWEIIYFKLYKSQLPVLEQALETAALMLGSDKSRGYCLEMICADFLAGSGTQENESEVLVLSLERLYRILPGDRREQLLNRLKEGPWKDCVRSDLASF